MIMNMDFQMNLIRHTFLLNKRSVTIPNYHLFAINLTAGNWPKHVLFEEQM